MTAPILASVLADIADILTVGIVLIGVVAILVALHCGAEFLRSQHGREDDKARKLRGELDESDGISSHSVFYPFFFRK